MRVMYVLQMFRGKNRNSKTAKNKDYHTNSQELFDEEVNDAKT